MQMISLTIPVNDALLLAEIVRDWSRIARGRIEADEDLKASVEGLGAVLVGAAPEVADIIADVKVAGQATTVEPVAVEAEEQV